MKAIFLGLVLSMASVSHSSALTDAALCTKDMSNPNLPVATCSFPACATGQDCLPPDMNKSSVAVDFQEPKIQWVQVGCPAGIGMGCWEVVVPYTLRLAASDPSGVHEIGLNIRKEVLNQTMNRQKYYNPAVQMDEAGRFAVNSFFTDYVPAGGKIILSVFELCARDRLGNEGCVYPDRKTSVDLTRFKAK